MLRTDLIDAIRQLSAAVTDLTQEVAGMLIAESNNESGHLDVTVALQSARQQIDVLSRQLATLEQENKDLREATRHLVNLRTRKSQ